MTDEDVAKAKTQVEEFKTKYGEYPTLPVRIKYRWMSTRAEGDLMLTRFQTYAISGYPGIVGIGDEETHDVVLLYDAEGRLFPNIDEALCSLKPHKRKSGITQSG